MRLPFTFRLRDSGRDPTPGGGGLPFSDAASAQPGGSGAARAASPAQAPPAGTSVATRTGDRLDTESRSCPPILLLRRPAARAAATRAPPSRRRALSPLVHRALDPFIAASPKRCRR